MYNRYIPQPDGSYRRNRMQEPSHPQQSQKPPTQHTRPKQEKCPPPEPPCPPQKQNPHRQEPERRPEKPVYRSQESNAGGFLRNLLPKDFDTGDLIIVLLLLLMAGDCEEDRNNALLTLALYFLM